MERTPNRLRKTIASLGPGLLFASAAIGTSHLVLSTRAGAHHGLSFLWVIVAALLFKYPFFEFGPRYAHATGNSLLQGYKGQGKWAVGLFLGIVLLNMFAVTGAVGAVSAGLLSTMMGLGVVPVPILAGLVIAMTVILLYWGGYSTLDSFIKIISIVLLVSVLIAFGAVLFKGPIQAEPDFIPPPLFEGAGLALMIALVGWMPSGMEASTMNSIWVVNKMKASSKKISLKESLFDFNLGYAFTACLAIMFLVIGAFTVFGSGQVMSEQATKFSNELLAIFTTHLGDWSWPVLAVAAFGTIYGTLITVIDAFTRSVVRALRVFRYDVLENNTAQNRFLARWYKVLLPITGLGGFCLFYFSATSMIGILQFATTLSFVTAPIICWLNLRAIQSPTIPDSHKPSRHLIILAYVGLCVLSLFAIYYGLDLLKG